MIINTEIDNSNSTSNNKDILNSSEIVEAESTQKDSNIARVSSKCNKCKCSQKSNFDYYGNNKLEVYNWLQDFPKMYSGSNLVEVQFKNTRKEYFTNNNNLKIYKGDRVVVETNSGYDVGEVTLIGKLVQLQMKKLNYRSEIRRIYRNAKPADIEKYEHSKELEHPTMLRAREIVEQLSLNMKISDVEIQGDGNKAIFYYIADGRVDFRQLIKYYASEFKLKIEMKQIGARQEAGRVGGIGPCGRQLCCSSYMSNFISVSTSAARIQDIPLNPQKLAGQCGKLKCCMNFEVDTYFEAQKKLPPLETVLETKDEKFFVFKSEPLKGQITYSTDKNIPSNLVTISSTRAFEIIKLNKKGDKPISIDLLQPKDAEQKKSFDLLDEQSITRFDNNNANSKSARTKKKNKKLVLKTNTNNQEEINNSDNNNKLKISQKNNETKPQNSEERKDVLKQNQTHLEKKKYYKNKNFKKNQNSNNNNE